MYGSSLRLLRLQKVYRGARRAPLLQPLGVESGGVKGLTRTRGLMVQPGHIMLTYPRKQVRPVRRPLGFTDPEYASCFA